MTNPYQRLSRYSFYTVLFCYASLLLLYVLTLLMYPSCGRSANLFIAALHLLPLLAFLPSIMRQHVRSYVWLCFMLLGYFLAAVPNALGCSTPLNILEPILIVLLFSAGMMYVRWRSRALKAALSATDNNQSDV
ncbi:DUF2069 domain-containing protein [Dasania marina]|uniref:DUF2069 domain-containing protein n=1 Tax=Dasania marina TaxID=471499 RepID=UPI0003762618|nr:DUF2069 domain-containing protein [Dasania marina]